ncbi:MAG TPA: bifunctional oligoribonuclease/PAP phosphatase NrnA [Desulfobulbus sp.]|nr:bifunctional oligoribonuclease/PAP phosphatase NrnA [Desulfobulbus sp.]
MMAGIEELVGLIQGAGQVVLVTHVKPDGDALGSLFGLADILQGMGKRAFCYLEEEAPHLYGFLPGIEQTETTIESLEHFVGAAGQKVLVIALDCGDKERLGKSGPLLRKIHPFVVIDHHKGNNGFGDLSWVEPHRSSTGEMICDLARALGQELSTSAATCLYTAIATDTGSFRYASTTSHTHRVAADLVERGARPGMINEKLYDCYPLGRLRLMQLVLTTLTMFADEQVAVISVTAEMLEQTGTTLEDTENFINLPRAVKTVRVAVFLKEGQGAVSVSLRSRGCCDVSRVAVRFGGGGHVRASGFRSSGLSLDQVREQLLPVLIEQLDC